ncbi:MAG: formate dehydrogenase accessory sulfurtransferase FdhD [Archaeoglobaceae archaeon]
MIVEIGERLEIARESQITLFVNEVPLRIMCTPKDIEDLVVGFVISEGLAKSLDEFEYSICAYGVTVVVESKIPPVEVRSSGCIGVYRQNEKIPEVEAGRKFKLGDVIEALQMLDIEEYKRTRGYHVAAVVGDDVHLRYDVGRHTAVDKAIGAALKAGEDLRKSFLILSGRISRGIAMKCVRSGIPLVASKAAILDSALEVCKLSGLSAVSTATNIAYVGKALEV